jgi:hypothetical protein
MVDLVAVKRSIGPAVPIPGWRDRHACIRATFNRRKRVAGWFQTIGGNYVQAKLTSMS